MEAKAFRLSAGLKLTTVLFLIIWLVLAAFPLVWILVMSFKLPIDSFASNPFQVIFGFETRKSVGGLSLFDMATWLGLAYFTVRAFARGIGQFKLGFLKGMAWILGLTLATVLVFVWVWPWMSALVNPYIGPLGSPIIGATWQHYEAVWIGGRFYNQFFNSIIITAGVVCVSLTVGTLAGYGLARTRTSLAFWLLIAALIFRALPHSVLVTGYLPPFIEYGLYGKHYAVIMVLVAINQPFTIWMLRSFFLNIPAELDEAAMVDGCGRLEAFWRVIMPVMWPGVITTGLFSFLLAYNDYLVTALLLDGDAQTMVPSISQKFNRETTTTDQVEAVAAAVSITAPLFLLVLAFQRQIVSGLTAGAVKG